jgi:hypothetical protein
MAEFPFFDHHSDEEEKTPLSLGESGLVSRIGIQPFASGNPACYNFFELEPLCDNILRTMGNLVNRLILNKYKFEKENRMSFAKAILSGFIGACTLTLIHETARRSIPDAPRMDILGMRAISKSLRTVGGQPPERKRLHTAAMVGDILANSLYYSLVGVGDEKGVLLRGAALGLAAGVGGVLLPEPLGLGGAPSGRSTNTKLMTVAWYVAGAVAAAAAYRALSSELDTY